MAEQLNEKNVSALCDQIEMGHTISLDAVERLYAAHGKTMRRGTVGMVARFNALRDALRPVQTALVQALEDDLL